MSRIAIFFDHDITIRHFLLNKALAPLEKNNEVVYVFPHHHRVQCPIEELGFKQIRKIHVSQDRAYLYRRLYHASFLRLRRRSPEKKVLFRYWYEQLGRRPFWISWFFSWNLTYPFYRWWMLGRAGPYSELNQLLEEINPDIIIHPTVLEGLFVSDLIFWGRKHKIPTVYLMNSWDNPAAKAMLVGHPDHLVVWGEPAKKHAVEYMNFDPRTISCLGAAQFDLYRNPPQTSPEAFRKKLGIPSQNKILLYAGSSKGLNETRHLQMLEEAIESEQIKNCTVLYRPHPWRDYPNEEKDFFSVTFKHVIMEPSMVECYKASRTSSRLMVEKSDIHDTHTLLSAIDCLISPLSTILLEATIHGKPVMAYLPDEDMKKNTFLFSATFMVHFREFFEKVDCIRCEQTDDFVPDTISLLKKSEEPNLATKLKSQSQVFVVFSKESYGERVAHLADRILSHHALSVNGRRPQKADVLWIYRRGRTQAVHEWETGQRSSDFFYGFLSLKSQLHGGFIEDNGFNPLWYAWYPLEKIVAKKIGPGFALHIPLWHIRTLRHSKVVVSTGDVCGLPVALLKSLGLYKGKLIYITHGLSDYVRRFGPNRWLPRFYRYLLKNHVDSLVTLSDGARGALAQWLDIPASQIHSIPYGTDVNFWNNDSPLESKDTILSVGSDAGRDFDTFLKAGQAFPLHIVTGNKLDLSSYPNAKKSTEHSYIELRDLYSKARFVVLSLHDIDQPTGQSTGLQAMACGKALIVTKTRGWWGENFLKDGQNCVLVSPGDANELREKIQYLWENPLVCDRLGANARQTVQSHFSESRMNLSLFELIKKSLGVNTNGHNEAH